MSVRLCYVSVIGLCYILCILQHFVYGGRFYPDTVYNYETVHPTTEVCTWKCFESTTEMWQCVTRDDVMWHTVP